MTTAIGMSVRLDVPLDEALQRARTALAAQGFGILTEIGALRDRITALQAVVTPEPTDPHQGDRGDASSVCTGLEGPAGRASWCSSPTLPPRSWSGGAS